MREQVIDGEKLQRIYRAVLDAYPRSGDLEKLALFGLGINLYEVASSDNLGDTVFDLLTWAKSQGRLDDLVLVAAQDRQQNQELQSLASFFQAPPPPRPAVRLAAEQAENAIPDQPVIHSIGGLEFVEIPAGNFWMGADDRREEESPRHQVYLSTYLIGRTPVTNAQYLDFVRATGHPAPTNWVSAGPNDPPAIPAGKADHPVVYVSWEDAQAFCRWLSQQTGQWITLPTEAQWEKAARGLDERVYPWGNNFDARRGNMRESGIGDTTTVDAYPQGASPYGVLDMCGNVWEWVQDWYAGDYYAQSPEMNPTGPPHGEQKLLRGGSWDDDGNEVQASDRFVFTPGERSDISGFRCNLEISA